MNLERDQVRKLNHLNLIRLLLHVLAGVWFWATPWWGSFTYNAWYMIPTMLLCLVVIPVLLDRLQYYRFFNIEG